MTLDDVLAGAGLLRVNQAGVPDQPLVVLDLDDVDWSDVDDIIKRLDGHRHGVLVGTASRSLPAASAPVLERLTCTLAPGGPGQTWVEPQAGDVEAITAHVAAAPLAAVTMAGLLRLTSEASVPDGLVAESLAYSMLLAGPEFARWRTATPQTTHPAPDDPVLMTRDGSVLELTLNRPDRHNAFGTAVRDGLLAGLEIAELDSTVTEVIVRGAGRSFCSGGDLDEFGTAPDPAGAHLVRLQQSAGLAVHRVRSRTRFEVHGACIGAGIELPSFAGRVEAHPNAWFRLPELTLGLVPGAGGTVSITHRIGRWRTAYMALTSRRIETPTALDWGLVDAVR